MNTAPSDILRTIVATKHQELAAAQRRIPLAAMRRDAESRLLTRDFVGALRAKHAAGHAAVIAEIKKASPSQGVIRLDFVPADIAQSYAAGDGRTSAACLSVLTDAQHFQGCADYLKQARASCSLPVLRKDFMVSDYHIYQSRSIGADCVLLIAACLDDAQLRDYTALAQSLHMAVLLEVHDRAELDRALAAASSAPHPQHLLLGINNRNLRTFAVDLETTLGMAACIPAPHLLVTESGIHTPHDVRRMREAGIHTFLVGEALMRAPEPGLALAALFANGGGDDGHGGMGNTGSAARPSANEHAPQQHAQQAPQPAPDNTPNTHSSKRV